MAAEDYMGLIGGRGVSAPSGVDLDYPNIRQALAVLLGLIRPPSKLLHNICTICNINIILLLYY